MSVLKMDKIPFLDLQRQYLQIKDEVMAAVEGVFSNTAFSGGRYVESFEKNFAGYCGTSRAVALDNGTSALHLAMRALDIGPGDEVIVPANTFIATAWGASHTGATPVFADCDAATWEIDPGKIEEKISPRTKAIIGVHLYGQPFDIKAVKEIADKRGLALVEDCAQAQGALYNGVKVGGQGRIGCFSFYPGKNLGAYGEAGAVVTNDTSVAERIERLRNHGSREKYYHEEVGFNMRMDGIQGAILDIKLRHLDAWNEKRKKIAAYYLENISNKALTFQQPTQGGESVYHLFVATVENRKDFMQYLNDRNIFPGLHYPVPCHLQEAYRDLNYRKGDFPHSEYLAEHCVSLPMFPELREEEVSYITETVNAY